jgi:hypothetical protein
MDLPAKKVSDGVNLPMLKTKCGATYRASPAESALCIAARKRLIVAAPFAALHRRGAPVVSPRICHGTTRWANACDPARK